MKRYSVDVKRTDFFAVEVEAENEEQAGQLAEEMAAESGDPWGDFGTYCDGFDYTSATEIDPPEERTFTLNVAMNIRAYGTVTVETDDPSKISSIANAAYIAENFQPHGSGSDDLDYDHPSQIAITAVMDENDNDLEIPEDLYDIPEGDWVITT